MLTAVNVQARGCEIEPHIRAHFEEKLHGLEKLWSRVDDAEVRLSHERGYYVAEVTLFAAGLITRAEERSHDQRQAFDAALHKLQAQLRRYKDKVQHKSHRQNNRDDVAGVLLHPKIVPGAADPAALAALDGAAFQDFDGASFNGTATQNGGIVGAAAGPKDGAANGEVEGDDIEGDEAPATLVRRKKFALKPMSPDEATLQMDLLGHDFFVFRDCKNNQVSVVYRRAGGGYGLIEPVAD